MKARQRIPAVFVLLVSTLLCNTGWATTVPPVSDPNGPYTGTVGVPVQFDGTGSYHPDGSAYVFKWDFGDGSSTGYGAFPTPTHTYANPGLYDVMLEVVDVFGNTDLGGTTADISAIPVPATVWLFGSGLLGLIGIARRRKVVKPSKASKPPGPARPAPAG